MHFFFKLNPEKLRFGQEEQLLMASPLVWMSCSVHQETFCIHLRSHSFGWVPHCCLQTAQ